MIRGVQKNVFQKRMDTPERARRPPKYQLDAFAPSPNQFQKRSKNP
jgi:hypothetical protein